MMEISIKNSKNAFFNAFVFYNQYFINDHIITVWFFKLLDLMLTVVDFIFSRNKNMQDDKTLFLLLNNPPILLPNNINWYLKLKLQNIYQMEL
jgi:hypothetical protein